MPVDDHDGERRVLWALVLTAGFMVVEVAGGLLSGSLALLADAGHMLTDAAALGLSFAAFRASRRAATARHSYGLSRFQVLAAFINGATLLAITLWIAVEAVLRLAHPVPVQGATMLAIAAAGLIVNIVCFVILHRGDRENLNIRGAALHVLGDLFGSAAAIVAAGVILATGWTPIDPILSLLVSLLIVRSAWTLLSHSWNVLMEGAPEGVDPQMLRRTLTENVPGVIDVHHIHLWLLTPGNPLLTLHATIDEEADHDAVLRHMQRLLVEQFAIGHATIQVERIGCDEPHCTRGTTKATGPAVDLPLERC